MKRGAGVKDSGDSARPRRFSRPVDSTLFSLPLIYAWLKIAGELWRSQRDCPGFTGG